ncbi:MAG: competence/damage-inducible protein A [Bacteroidales bacterium]|nr:competence/damage-inducible protein A [Bacteroidales bacterium]
MKAEIITIGDEILIGQVVDTNSAWIAEKLNSIGIKIAQIISISDTSEHIVNTLNNARKHANIILITGGLGPTKDDITKTTLADYFNTSMKINEVVLKDVETYLRNHGVAMNELNRQQAEVPENCVVIPNYNGTAPGMWFEKDNIIFISMPGVPYEMKSIMENYVLPELKKKYNSKKIIRKTLLIHGLPESHLAEKLNDWEEQLPENMKFAYLPSPGIIRLRLSLTGQNEKDLEILLQNEINKLYKIIPDNIIGTEEQKIEETIAKLFKKDKKTLSTAESCTGGNISHLITSVAGSSDYFIGSVVAYSNKIKEQILNVNYLDIEKYGAVSKQVVEQMAKGVLKLYNTDYAIATSGIAGPTGGTEQKPVGTTWIAVASKNSVVSEIYLFGNNRSRNISKASIFGLNMLRKLIKSS